MTAFDDFDEMFSFGRYLWYFFALLDGAGHFIFQSFGGKTIPQHETATGATITGMIPMGYSRLSH